MKIHTTQDLNTLVQNKNQQTTNSVSKDFRLKNYSEQMLMPRLSADKAELYGSSISFGKKLPKNLKDGKKMIKSISKKVGDIKKEGVPETQKRDKFLTGSFFNKALDVTDYETLATALVAAGACAARAGTIVTLPTKKNKEDNIYASSHALMSGALGFGTAFLLTAPFKAGNNYVMKKMMKNLKEDTLKRLYPHLETKSIKNADGSRKDIKEWLDVHGRKFIAEMKKGELLPEMKNLADVSEQTFDLLLHGKKVNWAAQKGASFNDVVLQDGSKLYDVIDMARLGIKVQEEGMNGAQILLKDLDHSFMEKLINDSKGTNSNWGKLDINSMYKKLPVKKGSKETEYEVVDFRKWKDINGKQWKLDLDEIGATSPFETAEYKPRISGAKRYDEKERVYKYTSYQENGIDGKLGTEIDDKMALAEVENAGLLKTLTWVPDLAFRIPIAATTIALIPWALKNIFHIQKSSAKNKSNQIVAQQVQSQQIEPKTNEDTKAVSFKGKGTPKSKGVIGGAWDKLMDKVGEFLGKLYGKPLLESPTLQKASAWLSKLPGNLTQHMTVFGSFITSGVYMHQTITNKDLDPDRRRTLAINQGLCFLVPTYAAYKVDKRIEKWVKSNEYRYSGINQRPIDIEKLNLNKLDGEAKKKAIEKMETDAATLSKKIKGFRTLSSITVFAFIYRYFTPVVMTPIANWLGDKLNAYKHSLKDNADSAKEVELNLNQDIAQESSINSENKEKQVA